MSQTSREQIHLSLFFNYRIIFRQNSQNSSSESFIAILDVSKFFVFSIKIISPYFYQQHNYLTRNSQVSKHNYANKKKDK